MKQTLFKAIKYATCLGIFFFIIVQLFAEPMAGMFAKDEPQVVSLAAHAVKVYFLCLPIIGFQIVSSGYFQATGKPLHSAALSLSRQVLAFIPALLIMPNFFGLEGAWMSAPIADGVATFVTAIFITVALKKLNNMKSTDDVGNLVK